MTIPFSEVISIESNIATAFNLRTFSEVVMQIVNPADVALDSVEITFKDQYMGRSEMWRLKNYLVSSSNSIAFASTNELRLLYCNIIFSLNFPFVEKHMRLFE